MIALKPIIESTDDYDEIERKIKDLFKEEIYYPLMRQFGQSSRTLKNSREDLIEAFRTGRLTIKDGRISGPLNATLTKELRKLGGKWDRIRKLFLVTEKDLPFDVRNAAKLGEVRFLEKMEKIDRRLAGVLPEELASKLHISEIFDDTLFKVEDEFQKSVKNITVGPQLSDAQRGRIAEEWQNNMRLHIRTFTGEQIKKLRSKMRKNVFVGNRYEGMIKTIQESYGVTANKAKFLARQETALLMTKFKEVRYQEVGIRQYKWKSVLGTKIHPVRPRHKELNDMSDRGKLFRFDDPPIVSEPGQPIRRANAGADFNCRCRAIPIIDFRK